MNPLCQSGEEMRSFIPTLNRCKSNSITRRDIQCFMSDYFQSTPNTVHLSCPFEAELTDGWIIHSGGLQQTLRPRAGEKVEKMMLSDTKTVCLRQFLTFRPPSQPSRSSVVGSLCRIVLLSSNRPQEGRLLTLSKHSWL